MKNRGRKIGITIAAMVLMAICAFFFYDTFFRFVLDQFSDINVYLSSTELLGQFPERYTFTSAISILPALFLFSHFVLKEQKPTVFFFIVPITLLCGIALMAFHIYSVRAEILEFPELTFIDTRPFSISNIHAARYLGIGFILGTVLSTAILSFTTRDRKYS